MRTWREVRKFANRKFGFTPDCRRRLQQESRGGTRSGGWSRLRQDSAFFFRSRIRPRSKKFV